MQYIFQQHEFLTCVWKQIHILQYLFYYLEASVYQVKASLKRKYIEVLGYLFTSWFIYVYVCMNFLLERTVTWLRDIFSSNNSNVVWGDYFKVLWGEEKTITIVE
jgi:hypothetical protein